MFFKQWEPIDIVYTALCLNSGIHQSLLSGVYIGRSSNIGSKHNVNRA